MTAPPKQRWFRYGLRTLLIFVTVVCIVLGMGLYEARRYQEQKRNAEEMIVSLGGTVQHAGWSRSPSPGANWLALSLGFGEPLETRWNVNLAGAAITAEQLRQLGRCEWLRVLDLSNTSVGDVAISNIAKITKLRELRLANTQITDLGLVNLKALERLYVLEVTGTAVTYDGLAELEKSFPGANFREQLALSRLGKNQRVLSDSKSAGNSFELDVFPPPSVRTASHIRLDLGDDLVVRAEEVADLRQLRSAKSFIVQGRTFPEGLAFLADLRNLESVFIYDTKINTVADGDLAALASLPRLTRLELYGNRLTDGGVAHLSGAHQIEHLKIHGEMLTPEMLVHLRGMRGLRLLELNFWHRSSAEPHYGRPPDEVITEVSENLRHLVSIPNLEELSVMGNLMVDDVVAGFAALKKLKSLKLDARFSSQAAAQSIRDELPRCQVERLHLE